MMLQSIFVLIGLWFSPSNKGSKRPLRSGFSLTLTDEDQAVMFGGFTPSGSPSAETHVLNLHTMVSHLG